MKRISKVDSASGPYSRKVFLERLSKPLASPESDLEAWWAKEGRLIQDFLLKEAAKGELIPKLSYTMLPSNIGADFLTEKLGVEVEQTKFDFFNVYLKEIK